MLSAMQASVAFIRKIARASRLRSVQQAKPEARATSKRNLVFVRFGRRRFFRRCAGLSAFPGGFGSAWRPTAEQLHVVGYHPQTCSLLSGLLVVPRVHLQPPFDENRSAFFQVLAGNLCCSSPESDIDKCDFLALFAAIGRVSPIHRYAEIADGTAFRRVTHFRSTCDISK